MQVAAHTIVDSLLPTDETAYIRHSCVNLPMDSIILVSSRFSAAKNKLPKAGYGSFAGDQ